jgi:carboxypeptidase D
MLSRASLAGALLALAPLAQAAFNKAAINAFNIEHPRRYDQIRHPAMPERSTLEKRDSKFLNSNTEKFVVNGTGIPEVDFDIGESYAGLLPVSQAANDSRQLFFWFFPTTNPDAGNEVTIW